MHNDNTRALSSVAERLPLPALLIDKPAFLRNVGRFSKRARQWGKSIRLGTKSLRIPALMELALRDPSFDGFLCFSPHEAEFLFAHLPARAHTVVAYPVVQVPDTEAFARMVKKQLPVVAMVDCVEHVRLLEVSLEKMDSGPLAIACDIDMSFRMGRLRIGALRSGLRDPKRLNDLCRIIAERRRVQLEGFMGYEAHIAGVPDRDPTSRKNALVRVAKRLFRWQVRRARARVHPIWSQWVSSDKKFFNGGGTGSFDFTLSDPSVTEVTVGSGLLQSALFDYFDGAFSEPAQYVALRVTRQPHNNIVTCSSGGFIASGPVGKNKQPVVVYPSGLTVTTAEGYGEVQTPFQVMRQPPVYQGNVVLFRPAKAGEIAERFEKAYLVEDGKVTEEVPTYRGLGQTFF